MNIELQSSLLLTKSSAVVNHAREHVNTVEYTEYFRVYIDLGNQGVTNAR